MIRTAYTVAALTVLSMSIAHPAMAEARFSQPRPFILDQPCQAYQSLKKQTHPEPLDIGKSYPALAENKATDSTHALLQLNGNQKWVALSCGHYTDAAPTVSAGNNTSSSANPSAASCLPFFDNVDNPVTVKVGGKVDITPPAPALNAFDQAVNAVCGKAGKVVSGNEFRALMQQHPEVLQRLKSFTHNQVFANRPQPASDEAYLNDLTEAWFNLKAFDHIFCGQPGDGGKIGGLHFYGRYEQLQQSGEACRMDNYRQNEVVPGVLYTFGVTMQTANGKIVRHSTKGYGYTLSAEDMLKAATRALAENPTTSSASTACLLPITDDGKAFTTVFVRRANGIRTFYPDGTPANTDPKCQAAINLN